MHQLIPFEKRQIGTETIETVNARDLHTFLEVTKDFHAWMRVQIKRARLIEGRDFVTYQEVGLSKPGRQQVDYFVTFDASKHIGMLSGTDKGYEVREYFIACEKELRSVREPDMLSAWDMLAQQVALGKQQAEKILAIETAQRDHERALLVTQAHQLEDQQRIVDALTTALDASQQSSRAETKADTIMDTMQWMSIRQYVYKYDLSRQIPEKLQNAYGRWLADEYCKDHHIPVYETATHGERWPKENTYPESAIRATLPSWLKRQNSQLRMVSGEGT